MWKVAKVFFPPHQVGAPCEMRSSVSGHAAMIFRSLASGFLSRGMRAGYQMTREDPP